MRRNDPSPLVAFCVCFGIYGGLVLILEAANVALGTGGLIGVGLISLTLSLVVTAVLR